MAEIEIPFKPRFVAPMEQGITTRTWRTKQYGITDDVFPNGTSHYVLTGIEKSCMGSVPIYWKQAGFDSPEDAIQTLKEIFPQNGYQPERMGWAHWFEKV